MCFSQRSDKQTDWVVLQSVCLLTLHLLTQSDGAAGRVSGGANLSELERKHECVYEDAEAESMGVQY